MTYDTVLVVYKRSMFELYTDQSRADKVTKAYVEAQPALKISHDIQQRTIETVLAALTKQGIVHKQICRADLGKESPSSYDLIISVGGDGTLLEVSHYVASTPVLGVNSNPQSSIGFFTGATAETIEESIAHLDTLPKTKLTRLQITKNDERLPEFVLNDVLICHANPAGMNRYTLTVDGRSFWRDGTDALRSSGLLISTAAGSTGWIYECGGEVMPLGSRKMQFHERDQRNSGVHYADERIEIYSKTREGRIYIDGEHVKHDFTLGDQIIIERGEGLTVIGDLRVKRELFLSKIRGVYSNGTC